MSETLSLCRLCSTPTNVEKGEGVFIFSDDGRRRFLETKIKLYLHFSVLENDDMPKNVCNTCVRKLESTHRFASTALSLQNHLRSLLESYSAENTKIPSSINVSYSGCDAREEKEDQTFKLMESTDCEIMEMEIDPNLILHGECNSSSNEDVQNSDLSQESDVASYMAERRHRWSSSRTETPLKRKPHVCTYCSRRFVLEVSLNSHLWLHKNQNSKRALRSRFAPLDRRKRPAMNRENSDVQDENNDSQSDLVESGTPLPKDGNVQTNKPLNETVNAVTETKPKTTERFEHLCGVCREGFPTLNELETHLEKHIADGKFGCSICSRVFRSKATFEHHQVFHKIPENDYTCTECGRVYSSHSALRSHLVSHSDLRPHKCSLCPKTFKRNQELKFHLNQHTGQRPYVCPICSRSFASSGSCFAHRKRVHRTANGQSSKSAHPEDVSDGEAISESLQRSTALHNQRDKK